jgi:hypothetical protein
LKTNQPNITIPVDLTNPGQFFACCGLLELADRLWPGAEGWFAEDAFHIQAQSTLSNLIRAISTAELGALDADDATASPMLAKLGDSSLRLDWWQDDRSGGKEMKVWAGSMESVGIARSMQNAMTDPEFGKPGLFDVGMVVRDVDNPANKKEPFYFDARRAQNAHSRDIGFSPNDLQLTTTAYPAVEFLCLVGLQRVLPKPTVQNRVYEYRTWNAPLPPLLIPAAVNGTFSSIVLNTYRFENWFRTGQRKHKAFKPATLISEGANNV